MYSCAQPMGSSRDSLNSSMSMGSPSSTALAIVTTWQDQCCLRPSTGWSKLSEMILYVLAPRPVLPLGVVISRTFFSPPRRGLVMEGNTALQVASGSSKNANSVKTRLALKPRTVSGLPGTAKMREPLANVMEPDLSRVLGPSCRSISSAARAREKASAHSLHLASDSIAWRSDGAAIIQVVLARSIASLTASAAVEKSLPDWRDQMPALKRLSSATHRAW